MRIANRKEGSICIVEISGEIKIGDTAARLREESKRLLEAGERQFIFNMLKVSWLDSSGIGETVGCRHRIVSKGGEVKLAIKGRSHDLFTIAGLQQVFELFDNMKDAVASFENKS